MHEVLSLLEKLAVVPALVVPDGLDADDLAGALLDGGLSCAEVTLRTPAALDALKRLASHSGGLLVGAGTVLDIAQADEAVAAGARFIVSPGMDAGLIRHCQARDIPIIPAACTPTEVMLAVNLGLECIKFFPCDLMGGLPVIKALHGPFPTMRFMPTGGVHLETMSSFLGYPPVLAVGGTWMVREEWLRNGQYDIVTDACAVTSEALKRIKRGVA